MWALPDVFLLFWWDWVCEANSSLRKVGTAFGFTSSRKKVWVSAAAGLLRFLPKLGWRDGSGAKVSPCCAGLTLGSIPGAGDEQNPES